MCLGRMAQLVLYLLYSSSINSCGCCHITWYSYRIRCVMWYVVWSCGMDFWPCNMIVQTHRKLQFRIFKCQKWLKPWYKKKINVCGARGHTPPNCTKFNRRSHMALLDTQLVEYCPTYHTIIWFSLRIGCLRLESSLAYQPTIKTK